MSDEEKAEIVIGFAATLVEQSEDIPPEYAQIAREYFWELIWTRKVRTMRLLMAAFALGVLTDAVIANYYVAIGRGQVLTAVLLSIVVTAIPFLVTERAITLKRRAVFIAYALGCGLGTAVGMMISL
jgi:hypothetical protein